MRVLSLVLTVAVAGTCLVLLAGCDNAPIEAAPVGSTPAVRTAVGPLPGPGDSAPEPENPYAKNQVALAQGRTLFVQYNCAGCHGGHAGGGMGPSLRDESWIYGDSPAHIFGSITEGRAHGMPAWGTLIPEEQIWKLTAYIQSLRTPLEPSPPDT